MQPSDLDRHHQQPPHNRHRFLSSSTTNSLLYIPTCRFLFFFSSFHISTGIALAAATPTRDLVENLVYFLSLVFRVFFPS
jgi:hypothetical protein